MNFFHQQIFLPFTLGGENFWSKILTKKAEAIPKARNSDRTNKSCK